MTESPLVSILCLCYNQMNFLAESLNSIVEQEYANIEILICDDYSKDNSVQVIEDWIQQCNIPRVKFIRHSENKGICKSLNELLAISKGKYIQVLALDDLLDPQKIARQVSVLEESGENQVMIFSDASLIDENSILYQNSFIPYHFKFLTLQTGNFYRILLNDNFIPAMSGLIKARELKKQGGWDENLSFEDYDMWLRLSKEYDFIYENLKSCSYRLHQNNAHKSRSLLDKSLFGIYVKHIEEPIMRNRCFKIVENLYLEGKLVDEHETYYTLVQASSFSERLIQSNKFSWLYRTIKLVRKLIRKIFS